MPKVIKIKLDSAAKRHEIETTIIGIQNENAYKNMISISVKADELQAGDRVVFPMYILFLGNTNDEIELKQSSLCHSVFIDAVVVLIAETEIELKTDLYISSVTFRLQLSDFQKHAISYNTWSSKDKQHILFNKHMRNSEDSDMHSKYIDIIGLFDSSPKCSPLMKLKTIHNDVTDKHMIANTHQMAAVETAIMSEVENKAPLWPITAGDECNDHMVNITTTDSEVDKNVANAGNQNLIADNKSPKSREVRNLWPSDTPLKMVMKSKPKSRTKRTAATPSDNTINIGDNSSCNTESPTQSTASIVRSKKVELTQFDRFKVGDILIFRFDMLLDDTSSAHNRKKSQNCTVRSTVESTASTYLIVRLDVLDCCLAITKSQCNIYAYTMAQYSEGVTKRPQDGQKYIHMTKEYFLYLQSRIPSAYQTLVNLVKQPHCFKLAERGTAVGIIPTISGNIECDTTTRSVVKPAVITVPTKAFACRSSLPLVHATVAKTTTPLPTTVVYGTPSLTDLLTRQPLRGKRKPLSVLKLIEQQSRKRPRSATEHTNVILLSDPSHSTTSVGTTHKVPKLHIDMSSQQLSDTTNENIQQQQQQSTINSHNAPISHSALRGYPAVSSIAIEYLASTYYPDVFGYTNQNANSTSKHHQQVTTLNATSSQECATGRVMPKYLAHFPYTIIKE